MNPRQKPRPLFFTPRSPWGRLPLKRAHQSHMRASETASTDSNEKHQLWGKEQQGIAGQTATSMSDLRGGAERTLDKYGVPRGLDSQQPQERFPAPGQLSGQIPPPEQKPLVSPQNIASERVHEDLKRKTEENQRNGLGGTGSMTWTERNRNSSALPVGEKERADGQLGAHAAVGVEYTKQLGLGEKGDLNGGVIIRTNTQQPFQPLDTKDANNDYYEKMRGPRAPGIKAFDEFYRKKQ